MAKTQSIAPFDWSVAAEARQGATIALRRAIHQEPELGLDTPETLAKVKRALDGLPLRFRDARTCTGAIAVLEGARPGRTVLLRADMDALPMPEDTPLDFRSRIPGAMHACGHDAHTAMLVSAAHLLAARRDELAGTIVFMFQPGEEGFHGAKLMIEEGLLDDPAPEAAFALHITPNSPAGLLGSKPGPAMASADEFTITVRGRGGHASMPYGALDPMPVACEIVTALNVFVTRRVETFDPAVVTVAVLQGGTKDNIIPETVTMQGTIRAVSERTRALVHAGVLRIAEQIALAHECTAESEIIHGFPVTVNHAQAVSFADRALRDALGERAFRQFPNAVMGAEDFSYVLQRVPGAMLFLGVCPEGEDFRTACACHSNRMMLNEAAMARGVAAHGALAERFLKDGWA